MLCQGHCLVSIPLAGCFDVDGLTVSQGHEVTGFEEASCFSVHCLKVSPSSSSKDLVDIFLPKKCIPPPQTGKTSDLSLWYILIPCTVSSWAPAHRAHLPQPRSNHLSQCQVPPSGQPQAPAGPPPCCLRDTSPGTEHGKQNQDTSLHQLPNLCDHLKIAKNVHTQKE